MEPWDGTAGAPGVGSSAIGQLLDELSWAGRLVRRMRGGGIGDENVLTTEVMLALDLLPRSAFLGAVIAAACGADHARAVVVEGIEAAEVLVLPGDRTACRRGEPDADPVRVQPDTIIRSTDSWVFVEAKSQQPRATFQPEQLARELVVTLEQARERHPLLLLVLGSPPPVKVRGRGASAIREAIATDLAAVTRLQPDSPDLQQLVDRVDEVVAWTTWNEIAAVVTNALPSVTTGNGSVDAGVHRAARLLLDAVERHA